MNDEMAEIVFYLLLLGAIILGTTIYESSVSNTTAIITEKYIQASYSDGIVLNNYRLINNKGQHVYVSSSEFDSAKIGSPFNGKWR